MIKRTIYLILSSLFLAGCLFANEAEQIAKLEAMVNALQTENTDLRQQLNSADKAIKQQNTVVADQEAQIKEYEHIERQAANKQDQNPGAALGREQGPRGTMNLGPFSFGGAIRAHYTDGNYGNKFADGAIDGPSRDEGTVTLDTLYFNSTFEYNNWIGAGEYRFYNEIGSFGGYHFLHTLWFGREFNNGSVLKAGITEVPFGIERFGTGYGFFNQLDNYVGLADDRDLGITYAFSIGDFDIDLGYFLEAEPHGSGQSRNSARGSYDVLQPAGDAAGSVPLGEDNNYLYGNYSPWEEKNQLNARVKYNFYLGSTENIIGTSFQWGELESQDAQNRFDDGDMWAASIFATSTYNNWQVKAAVTQYKYDIDQLKSGLYFAGHNPDQIVMGGFDTPFFAAAEGIIPSIGVSYTYAPKSIDFIDFIIPYVDYSILIKDGETNGQYYYRRAPGDEFQDSEQLTLGTMIGSGNWLIYIDLLFGKGAPLVGNENGQYFTGAALNDASATGGDFDDSWQHRFNINFGYYY